MAAIRLTQRRVDTLRPTKSIRTFRDAELKGYGVRVMAPLLWTTGRPRRSQSRRFAAFVPSSMNERAVRGQ